MRLGQLIDLVSRGLAHPAVFSAELETRGIDPRSIQVSAWPSGSESALQEQWSPAIIGIAHQAVVMIAEPRPSETLHALGLVCGYSSTVELASIRRGFGEARSAFRLARRRGGIAGPSDLVSLEALLEQQSPDVLAPFFEVLIAPLVAADGEKRGDLIRTLESFIAHDCQLQATARHLFVHVNTVRHRLARIKEITGHDPLTAHGLADLRIGVWVAERRRLTDDRLAARP